MTLHEDPASRIRRLLVSAEPRVRNAFLVLVAFLRDERTLDELANLLMQGRLAEALASAESAASSLGSVWPTVFTAAAQDTASFLGSELDIIVNFDQVNFRAVSQMQANQLRLVREFTLAQGEAVRTALTDGIRRGLNPKEQARMFRASIGLTSRQIQSVSNFRRLLEINNFESLTRALRDRRFDATVRAAISSDSSLSADQVDRMVERYEQRLLAFRAETIARTESLRAVHSGAKEMYRQAIDAGLIEEDSLERKWNTAGDGRVRDPAHTAMQGQVRGMEEPFHSGIGNSLDRPGDINAPAADTVRCRCAVSTRFKSSAA